MKEDATLIKLSDRGQLTLPVEVRKALGLRGGDAFQLYVQEGQIVLEPVAVTPVEFYTDARIQEFLEDADMDEAEREQARKAWGL